MTVRDKIGEEAPDTLIVGAAATMGILLAAFLVWQQPKPPKHAAEPVETTTPAAAIPPARPGMLSGRDLRPSTAADRLRRGGENPGDRTGMGRTFALSPFGDPDQNHPMAIVNAGDGLGLDPGLAAMNPGLSSGANNRARRPACGLLREKPGSSGCEQDDQR